MGETINMYNPDYVIHPGEYPEEILESREIKKETLLKEQGCLSKQ